ncbi:hypothetical protein UP06_29970 [Bradyrhizobium sp. LTSP857]|nr:hypothetical protein UP06_29970 [Bradyrhizobium sp. LTSP857]
MECLGWIDFRWERSRIFPGADCKNQLGRGSSVRCERLEKSAHDPGVEVSVVWSIDRGRGDPDEFAGYLPADKSFPCTISKESQKDNNRVVRYSRDLADERIERKSKKISRFKFSVMSFDGAASRFVPSTVFESNIAADYNEPACGGLKQFSQMEGFLKVEADEDASNIGRRMQGGIGCLRNSGKHHWNLRSYDVAVVHDELECRTTHHNEHVRRSRGIFFAQEGGRPHLVRVIGDAHEIEKLSVDCELLRASFAKATFYAVYDLSGCGKRVVISAQDKDAPRCVVRARMYAWQRERNSYQQENTGQGAAIHSCCWSFKSIDVFHEL